VRSVDAGWFTGSLALGIVITVQRGRMPFVHSPIPELRLPTAAARG
jgi:hypothetical protein